MRLTQPNTKATILATGLAFCVAITACDTNTSGNHSTVGDSVNAQGNTTNSEINNYDTSGATRMDSAARAGAGVSVTDTSGGARAASAKKKGKITAGVSKDDASVKIEADAQGYYNRSEIAPAYTGGQSALESYIVNSIEYPQQAIDNNVEGVVNVQFAVDEKGNITNVKTVGNKLGYGLEEQAVKVVSAMPKWTPGKVKGKTVKTWRTLPINYRLEG